VKSWSGAAAVEEEEEERTDFAPATVTSSSKLEDKDPSKHSMPFLILISDTYVDLLDPDPVTMKLTKMKKILYLFTKVADPYPDPDPGGQK
jgi:hypothetical protein